MGLLPSSPLSQPLFCSECVVLQLRPFSFCHDLMFSFHFLLLSLFLQRYAELGMSPTSVQGLLQRSVHLKLGPGLWAGPEHVLILYCVLSRQGLSSGGYVSTGDQLQESVYSSRGQYEDPPSSSRPRPVGGSTGKVIWMHY